jgi:hypothetical protein
MSDDQRPCVYVHTDHNADDVRVFYEIPEALAQAVRNREDDPRTFTQALADRLALSMTDKMVERAARAANLEAGRQRGLAFEDDWNTLTEQERGGWRLVARATLTVAFTEEDN